MPSSHFVADGRERLLKSPELRAELEAALSAIRDRYAPLLQAASPFGRLVVHWRMKRELRDEIERRAPEAALYVTLGVKTSE